MWWATTNLVPTLSTSSWDLGLPDLGGLGPGTKMDSITY